jgi:hypothetical protein
VGLCLLPAVLAVLQSYSTTRESIQPKLLLLDLVSY